MPSVGMRRSTRIFVPKSVVKDGDLGKVLRSGKRLALEADDEKQGRGNEDGHLCLVVNSDEIARVLPCYKSNGWREVIPEQDVHVTDMDFDGDENAVSQGSEDVSEDNQDIALDGSTPPDDSVESRYKKVYDRKRQRSPERRPWSSSQLKDERMHGTVYVRRKKKKLNMTGDYFRRMKVLDNPGPSNSKFEIIGRDPSLPVVHEATLDVTVDSSSSSCLRFAAFLVSVLKYMRSSMVTLSGLTAFMCCEPMVDVFSRHGVHFKIGYSPTNTTGLCRFFGDQTSVPLFWLDFSATPQSFQNLHYIVFFRSLYIPHVLRCFLIGLLHRSHDNSIRTDEDTNKGGSLVRVPTKPTLSKNNLVGFWNCLNSGLDGSKREERRVSTRRALSRSIRRKRSSVRSKRVKNFTSMRFGGVQHFNATNEPKTDYSAGFDKYGALEGAYLALPAPVSNLKQADTGQRDAVHNIKESQRCIANVLVIESDKCYREEGVTISLECSTSKLWHFTIKAHGVVKYRHQAQEDEVMRPNTTNRFNHAVIWAPENGWKLEFCDRMEWFTFKELHKECVRKNLEVNSAKTIPVPGVREVLNYDDYEGVPFVRPDYYITVHGNEVSRALLKKTANYDMDREDEEWLEGVDGLSAEEFEEIIDVFEKAAYRNPSEISDESKLTSLCSDLRKDEAVLAVYQYWLKKRKQKHAALLNVFECQPPRKARVPLDNVLRKKRSFKKQASQNGRLRPPPPLPLPQPLPQPPPRQQQYNFEGLTREEEIKRVEEAQKRAREAMARAVMMRERAQMKMENADLATYLAAMALHVAETVQFAVPSSYYYSSESSNPGSSS